MSFSEIEHSLHNIKMKKHQVLKDQNSNKFCLCAAHMTGGSTASGTTSWRKRDVEQLWALYARPYELMGQNIQKLGQ